MLGDVPNIKLESIKRSNQCNDFFLVSIFVFFPVRVGERRIQISIFFFFRWWWTLAWRAQQDWQSTG